MAPPAFLFYIPQPGPQGRLSLSVMVLSPTRKSPLLPNTVLQAVTTSKVLLAYMKPICQTGSGHIRIEVGLVGSFQFVEGP